MKVESKITHTYITIDEKSFDTEEEALAHESSIIALYKRIAIRTSFVIPNLNRPDIEEDSYCDIELLSNYQGDSDLTEGIKYYTEEIVKEVILKLKGKVELSTKELVFKHLGLDQHLV